MDNAYQAKIINTREDKIFITKGRKQYICLKPSGNATKYYTFQWRFKNAGINMLGLLNLTLNK